MIISLIPRVRENQIQIVADHGAKERGKFYFTKSEFK